MPSLVRSEADTIGALVSLVHSSSVATSEVSMLMSPVEIQVLYNDTKVGSIEIVERIEEIGHFPLSFLEAVEKVKSKIAKMSLEDRRELAQKASGIWEDLTISWLETEEGEGEKIEYIFVSESDYKVGYVVSG